MITRIGMVYLALMLLASGLSPQPSYADRALGFAANGPDIHILQSNVNGMTLQVAIPPAQIRSEIVDGVKYDYVAIAGYGATDTPGEPILPVRGFPLGIPPDVTLDVSVSQLNKHRIPGTYLIQPAPTLTLATEPALEAAPEEKALPSSTDLTRRLAPNPSIYAQNRPYPAQTVRSEIAGYLRDQRVAILWIYPIRYTPAAGVLEQVTELTINVRFIRSSQLLNKVPLQPRPDPLFEPLIQGLLANYTTAKEWRMGASSTTPLPLAQPSLFADEPAYKLGVDADGIYRLTYDYLQAAGVPVDSLDPRTFKLFVGGRETAILVEGQDDGSFDPGDYVLFFGQAVDTRYTGRNIYWLTYGGANGLRISQRGQPAEVPSPASPPTHTIHGEEQLIYVSKYPDEWLQPENDADHWFSSRYILAPTILTQTFTLTIASPVLDQGSIATFRARLQGVTSYAANNPDHHARLWVNSALAGDLRWDGPYWSILSASVPMSSLLDGNNVIQVDSANDTGAERDGFYVDWIEVDYVRQFLAQDDQYRFEDSSAGAKQYSIAGFSSNKIRVFDITNPFSVTHIVSTTITGVVSYTLTFSDSLPSARQYLALADDQIRTPASITLDTPSTLRNVQNRVDYIIITHSNFISAIQPLADYWKAQGLEVMIADVQDVYDEFSYGLVDARAIRDFLTYAYMNWTPPAPSYVLLVGDGNYDYRHYLASSRTVYIPPMLGFVDPYLGETASDSMFARVSGDDPIEDLYLGRIPALTSDQVTYVVNKILAYSQNLPTGNWSQRISFIADNAYSTGSNGQPVPDSAGNFWELSDRIANGRTPVTYESDRRYFDPSPLYNGETYKYPTVSQMRAAIQSAINAGSIILQYVGHASDSLWASEGLFTKADIAALQVNDKLAVYLEMTCLTGYFHFPTKDSLDETLLMTADKGAVAVWGASGLGIAHGHDYLNRGFFDALFCDGINSLGAAALAGKLNLYTSTTAYRDLLDTYLILGDPALRLPVTSYDCAEASLVPGWNQVSLAVQPLDASPAVALRSLGAAWQQAKAWDGATQSWRSAAPALPAWATTLTAIDARYGLWLQLSDFATLFVHGTKLPSGSTIPLYAGWTLLGAPIAASTPITTAWASLPWTEAWTYDANSALWRSATPAGGSLTTWEPGRGYWLKLDADATLTTP